MSALREKTIVDLSKTERHISYISYYSSSDDESTLGSSKETEQRRSRRSASVTKPPMCENNSTTKISSKTNGEPKPKPRLLRHRSKDPQHKEKDKEIENLSPLNGHENTGSPLQRLLNEEQRLKKQNKRSSQIFGVEPPIVAAVERSQTENYNKPLPDIADRALPKLPDEIESISDNEAVYVNTNSTNDSGLGSSTGVVCTSQDYANTRIPLKPAKVSQKLQQIMLSLQVELCITDDANKFSTFIGVKFHKFGNKFVDFVL
uniref:Uncharacterized protein n=1 Tax=Panagrolaimus sp. JU765 TaxID=591449 RepID=A0AC34PXC7_9BILA